jgi:hypothetical protein
MLLKILNGIQAAKSCRFFFGSELATEIMHNESIQNDDIIVVVYGLNQIGRNAINNMMNQSIYGDILMLYIGPYAGFKNNPVALDL